MLKRMLCVQYKTNKISSDEKGSILSHSFNKTREGLEVKGGTLDNLVLL